MPRTTNDEARAYRETESPAESLPKPPTDARKAAARIPDAVAALSYGARVLAPSVGGARVW